MVKTYIPRKSYAVQAVEWQPGMEFPEDGVFQPNIVMKHGLPHLREAPHATELFDCPLSPGYFIIKNAYGYEAFTSDGFHKEFVEAPEIHENGKTVV